MTSVEEDIYEVEKIIGKTTINGQDHYKVKWKYFGMEDCTWEPLSNLGEAMHKVYEFNQEQ